MNRRFLLLLVWMMSVVLPMASQSFSSSSWSGSGWALNYGYVVTNNHVIDGARSIVCRFPKGEGNDVVEYTAEVVQADEERDLAVIKINDPKFTGFGTLPYAFKNDLADVGESVFVLGYPMTTTMGTEIKLTTGVVSAHSGYENDRMEYQISAPVQGGNSGGPLFDNDGNVIGIINAKHLGAENVSYAIKGAYLLPLVNSLPEGRAVLPTVNRIQNMDLPHKVKSVRGCVAYIICSSRGNSSPYQPYSPSTPSNPTPSSKKPSMPTDPAESSGNSWHYVPSEEATPSPGSSYGSGSGSGSESGYVAPEDRDYIRENIETWGDCRNVAITKTNGDLALHGRNGWAGSGLPKNLFNALHELNEANEYIDDVELTENGSWCILYGDNGFRWYNIPESLEKEIRTYHDNNEVIYSVTFNDSGDWILISEQHYSASSTTLLQWLKEGCDKYGILWAACVTDDGVVASYEGGYKFLGNVPEDLKQSLRETNLDVYRIKIAGSAYFFADKEGYYRYKM